MKLPNFDELYVISDLHLGGSSGFQIFTSTNEAKALLDFLSGLKPQRVCLVINGDLVDFLAEDGAQSFNPEDADVMLRRIADDAAFKPVFDGLREFLSKANHHLAINLGNHDIELSLPWVRAVLLDILAGTDDAARGRVELVFEGTGYVACVGTARVMCLHGNEVDSWNVTAFETLRLQGRDRLQGNSSETWKPNAGSRMVVEVMNDIKRKWPFVDLLKPEMGAVPSVLIALDPSVAVKLTAIAGLAAASGIDSLKMRMGFLGEPENTPSGVPVNPLAASEARMRAKLQAPEEKSVSDLLARAEKELTRGTRPVDLIGRDRDQEYLGAVSAAWNWVRGKPKHEVVCAALDGLAKDTSFDLFNEDATFKGVDERVGAGFDFVITGHTHLERALHRHHGTGFYYNGGTWVGLMSFDPTTLADPNQFKPVFDRLSLGTLAALEEMPSLVERRNSFVKISAGPSGTRGELRRAQIARGKFTMELVEGSEHYVS
ncbi:MAG: metallophosphoesterase [Luteolibacter sp.]|uniref:metallophosphoesterase n=1 Tax=Luteolibacter sp. TaxID=1962973 RepID=UPI003267B1DE